MPDVSLVATLVATVLGFALGALWYGPLFGKTWMAAVGLTPRAARRDFNPAKTYGTTFVLGSRRVDVSDSMSGRIPAAASPSQPARRSGICWVATSLATNYLFEGRNATLMLINGGYHAVRFTLIGVAFGLLG